MKTLNLSRQQADQLATDLEEYLKFKDSSGRELFDGFVIYYGDMVSDEVRTDETIEMGPIVNRTIIDGEDVE